MCAPNSKHGKQLMRVLLRTASLFICIIQYQTLYQWNLIWHPPAHEGTWKASQEVIDEIEARNRYLAALAQHDLNQGGSIFTQAAFDLNHADVGLRANGIADFMRFLSSSEAHDLRMNMGFCWPSDDPALYTSAAGLGTVDEWEQTDQIATLLRQRSIGCRLHGGMERRGSKRVLELWEPQQFRELAENNIDIPFAQDIVESETSVVELVSNVRSGFQNALDQNFAEDPSPGAYNAMIIAALHIAEALPWNAKSDLLMTKLLAVVFGDRTLRAHPDSVYESHSGHFRRIEELPEHRLRAMERAVYNAVKIFKSLSDADIARSWGAVMQHLNACHTGVTQQQPPTASQLKPSRSQADNWALDAARVLMDIAPRFTGRSQAKDR